MPSDLPENKIAQVGDAPTPERTTIEQRFRIVNQGKMSWLVLLDKEVADEFTDKECADEYVKWFVGKMMSVAKRPVVERDERAAFEEWANEKGMKVGFSEYDLVVSPFLRLLGDIFEQGCELELSEQVKKGNIVRFLHLQAVIIDVDRHILMKPGDRKDLDLKGDVSLTVGPGVTATTECMVPDRRFARIRAGLLRPAARPRRPFPGPPLPLAPAGAARRARTVRTECPAFDVQNASCYER